MAGSVKDVDYWLPTEFLAEEKLAMHTLNFNQNELNTESTPTISFPVEFPYGFDSFASSSYLSSPVESTETESSDEDEFLFGLTRRLTQLLAGQPKKKWVMAGSPNSTLGGIGSTNGELSPPTTPFAAKSDSLDLIPAAAGDVERLKINIEGSKNSIYRRRGLLGPANGVKNMNTGFHSNQRFAHGVSQSSQYNHHQQHQIQSRGTRIVGYENGRCVCPLGLPQSAWPALQSQQNKHHHGASTSSFLAGGSGAKAGRTGTGVFLPRRYENTPRYKKKSEALVERRNGLLGQQKGNLQEERVMK